MDGGARGSATDRLADAAEEAPWWGGAEAAQAPHAPQGVGPAPPPPPRRVDDAAQELAQELKAQGNRLLQSGQVEAAEMVYSEALKHDPYAHAVLTNRALARCKLGRAAEAVADARAATSLAPSWSKGHARLGACLHAAARFAEAVTAFERAAWLARAYDHDEAAQAEYEAAITAAKTAQMARSARRTGGAHNRDGF